ncbi:lantibiotic dehydratase [Spirosoma soli]|uniref:Lantibiotic dehydratase n=1 Tax=Spirosoma soli TaxID=1770529 RepID=A0ABW5M9H9_9BACT
MSQLYRFHSQLVLRTPYLPFTPDALTEQSLRAALAEPWFQDALYLASPTLFRTALEWRDGVVLDAKKQAKLIASLVKYYSRMMSRCTPFGLFAACSLVDWSDTPTGIQFSKSGFQRHTRFDMHFLCALAQHLATLPLLKMNLLYYPNSSYYRVGDEIRYAEYLYVEGKRSHRISAVTASHHLDRILAAAVKGATYEQLTQTILDDDVTPDEAAQFLDDILAAQLLVNELEPAITGDDFLAQLIVTVEKINNLDAKGELNGLCQFLQNVQTKLARLDDPSTDQIATYRQIQEQLAALQLPFDEAKLLQTDLFRYPDEQTVSVDAQWQNQLIDALHLLRRIAPKNETDNLKSFAQRFYDRYEDQEVPLLQALDVETGIGYLDQGTSNDITPLIDDIALPSGRDPLEYGLPWNKTQNWLHTKLLEASQQQAYTVDITDADFGEFPAADLSDLPASLAAMFRLVDTEAGTKHVLLEGFSGSSAVNLLGRFAHGHAGICHVAQSVATEEQRLNPDVLFAEIIHLPESRVGNILLHPPFRPVEIPYLAKSSRPVEDQLDLRDLFISVRGNEVMLRSKRLGKQIIPRLSTAHNYSYRALPVYQFLCDLQNQGKRPGLSFNWGAMARHHSFLPRVTYKSVILLPASWQLAKDDFAPLLASDVSEAIIRQWQETWRMPRFVVLADGDNELLVDWQNPLSIRALVDAVKNRSTIILAEFLYENQQATVQDHANTPHTNQFIAPLVRTEPAYTLPSERLTNSSGVQRLFSVGSEWLYFKLYCGVKSADQILLDVVRPVTEQLLSAGLIDKWFFIRYTDPKPHLRFRLHLSNPLQIGDVIRCVRSYLEPFEQTGVIWKTQLDTYVRELERYGMENIVLSETLFYYDSTAVLDFLERTWGDDREQLRWLWGIRAVDDLLRTFGLDLTQRHRLMLDLKTGFAQEFRVDQSGKQQLDQKYRTNRPLISQWLNREQDLVQPTYELLTVLYQKHDALAPLVGQLLANQETGQLKLPLSSLLASYVHMLLNRLIPSNQRLHELLIYDFLYRQYDSDLARLRKQSPQLSLS